MKPGMAAQGGGTSGPKPLTGTGLNGAISGTMVPEELRK